MSPRPAPRHPHLMLLAIASWLPLALALALIATQEPGTHVALVRTLAVYAAVVLGFVAGARFGMQVALADNTPLVDRLAPGVALIGLAALMLPNPVALAVLVVGFAAMGALDAFSAFQGRLPRDYARARAVMTWLFALTLMAIFVLVEVS